MSFLSGMGGKWSCCCCDAGNAVKPTAAGGVGDSDTTASFLTLPTRLVDLNTATEATLACLPGMTPARVRAWVEYRRTHRPLRKLWELSNVPGFGEATIRGLQSLVGPYEDTPMCCPASTALAVRLPQLEGLPAAGGAHVVVATWNMCRLSLSKPDFALHIVAAVIRQTDVLAMQEVMDVRVLEKLLLAVPEYDCVASPPTGAAESTYHERYAVFYRRCRLRVLDAALVTEQGVPTTTRAPFRVVFTGGLQLTTVHAVYGKSPTARVAECASFAQACNSDNTNTNTAVHVVAGDFNVPVTHDSAWQPWTAAGYTAALASHHKTTVAGNALDNILLRPRNALITAGVHNYVPAVQAIVSDVAHAISDHLPAYVAVRGVGDIPNQPPPSARATAAAVKRADTWYVSSVTPWRYGEVSSRLLVPAQRF